MGFDDSKALAEGDRERLFEALRKQGSIGWVIEEISATEISEVVFEFVYWC
jgi:ribonuclease HII